jgi:ADP-heptose:LPS heptosyltransferase
MSLDYKKILLIKLRYIGDTINLLPVAANIKKQIPHAHLSVMINTGAEDILKHSKHVDQLICYDRKEMKYNKSLYAKIKSNLDLFYSIRKEKYDLVIDFSGADRTALITLLSGAKSRWGMNNGSSLSKVCYNHFIAADINKMHVVDYQFSALQQIGFAIQDKKLVIDIPENIQDDIEKTFSFLKQKSIKAVIHPGARRINRRWPPISFARIANLLKKHYGADIILVSAPDEKELLDEVAKSVDGDVIKLPPLSLIQLAAFIKKCDLYIGNDTGTSHLAAGAGIKIITLFGPQFPQLWAPYTDQGVTVFKNMECVGPCNHIDCIYDENRCMTSITEDEVWEKINKLVKRPINVEDSSSSTSRK